MSQAWIDEMAAQWFAKAQEGMSAFEHKAFEQWLHVNPEHAKTYAKFERVWQELDGLSPLQNACQKKEKKAWWAYVCVAAVACFCIGLFQWHAWTHRLEFAQTFQTPIGTMQEFALSDGTTLFLDTDTHVSVSYYAHERKVMLYKGQVLLHVKKQSQRPLFVDAKNVRIEVTGTRFEVRSLEEDVRVSVEEGSVDVSYKRLEDETYLKLASLKAHEQLSLDERGFVKEHTLLHNPSIAPWKMGRLVFHKTPLSDIVKEFERYGVTPVEIKSEYVGQMTLSGSFEIARFSSFMELLPKVLPVKTTQLQHKITIEKK